MACGKEATVITVYWGSCGVAALGPSTLINFIIIIIVIIETIPIVKLYLLS